MDYTELRNIVREEIKKLELSRVSITADLRCGIIDEIGAVRKETMIDSKEFEIKKEAVKKLHVTKDGTPRKISPFGKKGLYRTFINKSEPPIIAMGEDGVYKKLFVYYGLELDSTKFKDVFRKALKEKAETENIKDATTVHLKSEFNRFFVTYSNTLPDRDIRAITSSELKAYTQKWTNATHPTLAVFKAYKGVLNLVFRYAYCNGLIALNPVVGIRNSAYNRSMSATKCRPEDKIFSPEEIEQIKAEINKRFTQKKYEGYFINGYAILFSIETGARVAEICALKWSDVDEKSIWIHSQQLKENGWSYCPYTKNERLLAPDDRTGRYFPLTKKIKAILDELKAKQEELGIKSEYIFCHEDGDWIKTSAYQTCLRRMCRHVFGEDCEVTNNHAFRMSLNSNVFIPKGLPVTERARLLGHSVETNLRRYSFAGKGNLADVCDLLDA